MYSRQFQKENTTKEIFTGLHFLHRHIMKINNGGKLKKYSIKQYDLMNRKMNIISSALTNILLKLLV